MKYGFVIDQRTCTGCQACTVACKAEQNVPLGTFRTWVKYIEKGAFPNTRRFFSVLRCNHCDNAPCVTICPTVALFTRPDGIVDFDSSRCIGCKACLQACPYDALSIDPTTQTAAKCNYCTHRTELGLQPACVVVCPEQAIIAGDLDNPNSRIARLVAHEPVTVRKPEQGTQPKLFYVGADAATLTPGAAERGTTYLWSERPTDRPGLLSLSQPLFRVDPTVPLTVDTALSLADAAVPANSAGKLARIREVYNVYHAQPWGGKVSACLWTRSIAGGALLVAALASLLGPAGGRLLNLAAPLLALLFTMVTVLFSIADLKRPDRFLYVLLKPNSRSWLVRGAWILIVNAVLASCWLAGGLLHRDALVDLVRWPAALSGLATAGYSAFLFGQAEGCDFWQSPLLLPQLLISAVVAGSSGLLMLTLLPGAAAGGAALINLLTLGLFATGLVLLSGLYSPPANADVALAARLLTDGLLAPVFWGGAIFIGLIVPLALLAVSGETAGPFAFLAAVAALSGLLFYEDVWVQAGQAPPLS